MDERFSQLPQHLRERARTTELDGVPTLLAHPDWTHPAPVVLWMHGRTAHKELDPGRYLRWIRAGIACVSIDLPGHGARYDIDCHHPRRTMDVLERVLEEIDGVLTALGTISGAELFDKSRMGIGGMSAGGMATLRRLCDPHQFKAAAVEATTGWLEGLYFPEDGSDAPWKTTHERDRVRRLDPMANLMGFTPIPLLALHTEADEIVPVGVQRAFIERLREHYTEFGRDPGLIEWRTWPETGAPSEHAGFGTHSNEAKNLQTAFLARHLGATAPADPEA